MLSPVEGLGIKAGFAAVRHVIADLELSFARTQREDEGVPVLLFLRHGSRVDGLSAGGHGHALVNLGALRKIELEALIAHLRAWRVRGIVHGEKADALQLTTLCLKAHHIGGYAYSFNFFRDVVNLQL